MVEIRVTRPELYRGPTMHGYGDLSTRQGHYFQGETVEDAMDAALSKYPSEVLDVQAWSNANRPSGEYIGRIKLRLYGTPDESRIMLPPEPTVFVEAQ